MTSLETQKYGSILAIQKIFNFNKTMILEKQNSHKHLVFHVHHTTKSLYKI
jgi:hypothetical protein